MAHFDAGYGVNLRMKRMFRACWVLSVMVGTMVITGQTVFGQTGPFDPKFVEVTWTDEAKFAVISGELSSNDWIGHSPARWTSIPERERFPGVVSSENQPRNVMNGSNPHQGVDLAMFEGQLVYPVGDAVVEKIVNDRERLRKQMGEVILNLDVNSDGTPDNVYMNYLHVVPDEWLHEGMWVSKDTPIAVVSAQMPGRYGAHLHFNWSDSENKITYKTSVMFRHVPEWSFGSDLDVLANEAWVGNVFYIHGTINNFENRFTPKRLPLKRIELYYQKNNTFWTQTPLYMQSVKGTDETYWRFDFRKIAHQGDKIRFYVNGIRGNDDSFPNPDVGSKKVTPYSWARWPQSVNHPPRTPIQFGNQEIDAYEFEVK